MTGENITNQPSDPGEILRDGENMGEMPDADAVGTAGSEDCGDMLRMWVKFTEKDGRKVIDRASFQTFGCQTALAVATVAARMIRGKTAREALDMKGEELSAPLGPLPPMKIHCAQLVEDALREALTGGEKPSPAEPPTTPSGGQEHLAGAFQHSSPRKIVFIDPAATS
jgi:nitrogen fixation NifU-like protein